jgi:transcription antitermination factor NusG
MSAANDSLRWFALTVSPRHEQMAGRGLLKQGFEVYLPVYRSVRRWSDRMKESQSVLFPGYVFCRFGPADRLQILQSHGVRSIVRNGNQPVPVEDDEIAALRTLLAAGRDVTPWPYIRIGQTVVIDHGPLASLRGVIVRAKNLCRVVVSVNALGTSIAIEVDYDMLAPPSNVSRSSPNHPAPEVFSWQPQNRAIDF